MKFERKKFITGPNLTLAVLLLGTLSTFWLGVVQNNINNEIELQNKEVQLTVSLDDIEGMSIKNNGKLNVIIQKFDGLDIKNGDIETLVSPDTVVYFGDTQELKKYLSKKYSQGLSSLDLNIEGKVPTSKESFVLHGHFRLYMEGNSLKASYLPQRIDKFKN